MDDILLEPVVSRRLAPFTTIYLPVFAGNDTVKIVSGSNLGVPNVWEIETLRVNLVNDATVANRYFIVDKYNNGLLQYSIVAAAITAGQDKKIMWNKISTMSTSYPDCDQHVELRDGAMIIAGDDYFKVRVAGGVAGDNANITMLLKWKNWDLGMMLPRIQKDSK